METPSTGSQDQLIQLFDQLADLDPAARAQRLSEITEPKLKNDLESLLVSLDQAHDEEFLEGALLSQSPSSKFSSSDADSTAKDLKAGDRIGDFIIEKVLGRGSQGAVYKAHQVSLGRTIALKVCPETELEGQKLAQMDHPNIVRVYSEGSDQGVHFTCLQYIDGISLDHLLKTGPSGAQVFQSILDLKNQDQVRFDSEKIACPKFALQFFVQLVNALGFAHRQDLLHLDLKPGNILVDRQGKPYLSDFGISLQTRENDCRKILGATPAYMAPEQGELLQSTQRDPKGVDQRTDIYSLGLIFQKLISEIRFGSQDELIQNVIAKAVANNPAERYPHCRDLENDLRLALDLISINQDLEECHSRRDSKPFKNVEPAKNSRIALPFQIAGLALAPQIIASVINISYNSSQILHHLSAAQMARFENLCWIYNLLIYPLAIGLLIRSAIFANKIKDPKSFRHDSLRWGDRVFWISCLGWLPGAFLFPFGVTWGMDQTSDLSTVHIYAHFFVSFALSWWIAMNYSTLLALHRVLKKIYPVSWQSGESLRQSVSSELPPILSKVQQFSRLTVVVPLAGAILILARGAELSNSATYQALVIGLIGLGMLGVHFALNWSNQIRELVAAFDRRLRP